jgi:hypothetical protein
MIALESADSRAILEAIVGIIQECVELPTDAWSLAKYDIEYIFLQLRSKSIGETINTSRACINEECGHWNDIDVPIGEATIENINPKDKGIVKLDGNVSLELCYANIGSERDKAGDDTDETTAVIDAAASSLVTIYIGDESHDARLVPQEARIDFIESLNTAQFNIIVEYLAETPYLIYDGKFRCQKCGTENEFDIIGLIDFFT